MSNLLGPNGLINVNFTTTVQQMMDQCKLYSRLQNFFNVGGINGQPGLQICANVNQMLLIRRMAWKFNRVSMGSNNPAINPHFFIGQQGFQDFHHAGATCFTLINSTTPGGQLPAGGAGVDLNPGVYQNGPARVNYGTFNGGPVFGPTGTWQPAGIVFSVASGGSPVFTALAIDNFATDSDQNPLNPSVWTAVEDFPTLQVLSGQCFGQVNMESALIQGNEVYTGVTLPADQYAEIIVGSIAYGDGVGMSIRNLIDASSGYQLEINSVSPETTIQYVLSGPHGNLSTVNGTTTPGDVIRLYAIGNVITVTQNGTILIQVTDSTLASGSYATAFTNSIYGPDLPAVTWITYFECGAVLTAPTVGDTFIVQFLDPHPFLPGNIGSSVFLIQGAVNPAYNSQFVYNQLTQLSGWINGYTLVSIPDQFHIELQQNGGQLNTITAVASSGNQTTITFGTPNPLPVYPPNNFNGQYDAANTSGNGIGPGSIMVLVGLTTNTGLNGKTVTLTKVTATTATFTTPTGVMITAGSDTGTIYAANSGAPGIFNLGWVESAATVDINNPSFPLPVAPIEAVHRIAPEYTSTGDNLMLSAEKDYGNGVIRFRLSEPVSTYPFAFTINYQAKAPTFINGSSIFQWPDDLSWVIFEMCLWQGMRFAYGSTASETQLQMESAMNAVQRALESEDRESNDMSFAPEWNIMRG